MTLAAQALKEKMDVEELEEFIGERIEDIWRETDGNEARYHQAIVDRIQHKITNYQAI